MNVICKFSHDQSLLTTDSLFQICGRVSAAVDWYTMPNREVIIGAVNLDEGRVHLFTVMSVYEVMIDSEAGFVVQKIGDIL